MTRFSSVAAVRWRRQKYPQWSRFGPRSGIAASASVPSAADAASVTACQTAGSAKALAVADAEPNTLMHAPNTIRHQSG